MADFELTFTYRNQRFNDAAEGLRALSKNFQTSVNNLGPVLKKELQTYLEAVAQALAVRHGNPWPGGTGERSLSFRSGNLVNTIRNSVKVYGTSLDDIAGSISAPFYARIQETGGTIRAKNAKYLTIPLPAALNANGTPKKRSARDWANTFIIKSKAGNLLICQRVGKDLVPLYVLKTSVTIPARLNAMNTMRAGLNYFVDHATEAMLRELQKGLGK